ncbi:MAG: hypothetical protein A2289_16235 [Deltaproteobacteria bacterium RIFOXYA12_FULL_58_15]|nr:MAG: hypothetical protein A2289_16235 [Deltaproteobacteria bacterium RIFOXYA12_FULL_58_15]OGR09957.1 MAG: hypothetical protein A2341_12350 [Deltaproteobacteria bacterium RIFOXYB12_FULL_58_9]
MSKHELFLSVLACSCLSPSAALAAQQGEADVKGGEEVEDREVVGDGVRWFAVPNFAYGSDDGLIFGARGELAIDEAGYEPYKSAYVLHVIVTSTGFHHHRFRYDRVGLGPDKRFRLTLHVAWRQWLNDGYWGIGNTTTRERAYVGSFDADDPHRKRYRYSLFQPFVHATLRADLNEQWQAFASLNTKWSAVETYPDSLLLEQQPYGINGGLTALLSMGVLWDTRDPETTPQTGYFCELSGRVAPPLPHGAGFFGGVFLSLRAYWALAPWVTFAVRGMTEWLFGDIPFYEMVHWGGAIPVAGFGGAETLRGVAFGRWRAPGKAILNTELRFEIARHSLFDRPMRWQLVPYVDAGSVYGAGDLETSRAGMFPVHPATGAGIRAIFDEAFVGRIDAGLGLDPVQSQSGNIRHLPNFGIYVVFDHTF